MSRPAVAVCVCALLLALQAAALQTHLQPSDVDKAYGIGRASGHEAFTNFLKEYRRTFEYPPDQPFAYAKQIEFETPYERIALKANETPSYDRFQALDDYNANPGLIRVRVTVSLRSGYVGPPPSEDSFQVTVSQSQPIKPQDTTNKVICDPYNPPSYPVLTNCTAYTSEIDSTFQVAQFAPGNATIKVILPHSRPQEAAFNLDRIK